MKVVWDKEKNKKLLLERGVSFEMVEISILENRPMLIISHYNGTSYLNQQLLLLILNAYTHIVPFEKKDGIYYLKTIIPSRKHHELYFLILTKGKK